MPKFLLGTGGNCAVGAYLRPTTFPVSGDPRKLCAALYADADMHLAPDPRGTQWTDERSLSLPRVLAP
jgi:hypothetical protein